MGLYPYTGFAANMISFNVLFFWTSILFVFRVGGARAKKEPVPEKLPVPWSVPEAAPNVK
jgi:cytochrome bd ubiquinol oxidase subunit I